MFQSFRELKFHIYMAPKIGATHSIDAPKIGATHLEKSPTQE
jgi:hypothetical protein